MRPHKKYSPRKSSQAGNIFFMLFASVALIGAITVGANNTFKGIVTSMSDVTRKTIAEEKMMGAARIAIQASTATAGGDCDSDGTVEPLPFRTATGLHPEGGGWVPVNIGATEKDPWGTPYGYCAWDPGTTADAAGCGGPGANRLTGSDNPSNTIVAVISAGKDRKFSSICENGGGGGGDTTTGLVHHWEFDEGSGTSANDTGSGNSDGIFVNTPAWTAGTVGAGSLAFNGTNNFIRTPTSAATSAQGTLSAWVYPTVANPAIVEMLLLGSREPNRIYLLHRTNGNLGVRLGTGAEQDTGDTIPVNTWSHVAMTWSGGTWKAYLNGAEVGTGAYGGLGGISDCPSVGAYHDSCSGVSGPDAYFTGRIDDARIYNRVLSEADITALSSMASSVSSVTRAQGSDDIVLEYTYNDAAGIGGLDLWKVKDVAPDTAIIDKNIEVAGTTEFGGALNLMGAGLILPDSTATGACDADADQSLRMNFTVSPPSLEICDYGGGSGLDWTAVSMAGGGGGGTGEWAPPADLVARWKLDETTGSAIDDDIGTSNGTWTDGSGNSVAQETVAGMDGTAITFDGSNDYINVAATPAIGNIFNGGGTISAWIYPTGWGEGGVGRIFEKATAVWGAGGWNLSMNGTTFSPNNSLIFVRGFSTQYGDWIGSANSIILNQWNHVAVVYNDSSVVNVPAIYVNGIPVTLTVGDTPVGTAVNDAATNLILGNNVATDRAYAGTIDDIMMYERALSGREVMDIYQNTGGFTAPPDVGGASSLIRHYKLDETGNTSTAADSGTDAANGTLTNFPGDPTANWVLGVDDNALNFDGTDDYITSASVTAPESGTASVWIKADTVGGGTPRRIWSNHDNFELWITNTGLIQPDIGQSNQFQSTSVVTAGTWYHLAVTWDDVTNATTLYINGVQNNVDTDSITLGQSGNLVLGWRTGASTSERFDGLLDDFRLYDEVLSPAEILTLFNTTGGTSLTTTNPGNAAALNANQYRGKISSGGVFGCGIQSDTSLWCWGDDSALQLGNGTVLTATTNSPSRVENGDAFIDVAASNQQACALKKDGTLWCWGANSDGRLGLGDTTPRASPTQVGTAKWTSITMGTSGGCGVQVNGAAYCWGAGTLGKLGNNGTSQQNAPVAVNTASGGLWSTLSAGHEHTCGIKTDGSAWCWGSDGIGRLGDGATLASVQVPEPVTEQGPWTSISAGENHTCAVKLDGTAWCWGQNTKGQLGIGLADSSSHPIPERVADLGPWLSIAAGEESKATCGIKTNGTMWCWGEDLNGRLGNGSTLTADQALPTLVSDSGPWVEISFGAYPCGMKADGSAWCWGPNSAGQAGALGTGNYTSIDVPGRVVNFPAPPPFRYTANTVLEAPGTNNIAMGTSGISYDGASDATPLPDGLSFPGSGRTRLRQGSGSGGPVAWWMFDEGAGTTYYDATVNANHGSASNAPAWAADRNAVANKAVQFDNTNDRVDVTNSTSLNSTNELTVAFWLYPVAFDGSNDYVSKTDGVIDGTWQWSVQATSANNIGLFVCDGANAYCDTYNDTWSAGTTAAGLTTGAWQHIVITFSSVTNQFYIYKNGVSLTIDSDGQVGGSAVGHAGGNNINAGFDIAASTAPVRIGYSGCCSGQSNARMDNVMIFNRAITGAEAAALYNGTWVPDTSGGSSAGGVELKVETLATNSSAQISMKATDGANSYSVGIDNTNSILKFGANNAGVTNWMSAVTSQMEILPTGNVGVGTTGTAPFRLNINGGLKVGDDTAACTAEKNGTLKYVSGDTPPWKYCDGGAWVDF